MEGKNSGVKTLIDIKYYPRTFFIHSGYYNWNLLLSDTANFFTAAKISFGFAQKIYILFYRCQKFMRNKLKLSIKPVSDIKWPNRKEARKVCVVTI